MKQHGRSKRVWRRWWFWPIVLVAAVVGGGWITYLRIWPPYDMFNAAVAGDVERLEFLLDRGADINARGYSYRFKMGAGAPPISFAAAKGGLETVEFLLARGADPTIQDQIGWTCLHYAGLGGEAAVVDRLASIPGLVAQSDQSPGGSPLTLPARFGHADAVAVLVAAGASVRPKGEQQLLVNAAEGRSQATFMLLLEAGADAHARRHDGTTPLMVAASHGWRQIVKELLARDVLVIGVDSRGRSALTRALLGTADAEIIRLLLGAGAQADLASYDGTPLIILAVQSGRDDVVAAMLEALPRSAVDDRRGRDRATALHVAAAEGGAAMVELLIEAGADPSKRRADGLDARQIAARRSEREAEGIRRLLAEL
ncbi:MAG: ankyrin repeat domain-containing protein [Phycisphaerales bacterium JB039]